MRSWRSRLGVVCIGIALLAGSIASTIGAVSLFRWEGHLRNAWIRATNGDPDKASWELSQAFWSHPEFLDLWDIRFRLSDATRDEINGAWLVERFPGRADVWVALANARARDPRDPARAIGPLVKASELDPWSIGITMRIADLYDRAGDRAEAARWARRALENDAWLRLDPVVRLDPATRARMEALAAGADPMPESGNP